MSDVTVTIEQDSATQAFERLGPAAAAALKGLAKETAYSLQAGVRSRLQRQIPGGTGRTVGAITVEEQATGYRVTSGDQGPRPANLPIWLEYGTKHMSPRPAWDAEIRLHAGPYNRRVEDVLQRAIDGLGGA